jgi:type I restriction enzyme S subunit
MSTPWPLVPLREILTPVSRPEDVDPQVMYRLLGAHWYAQGLYTKEVKTGSQIQAAKLYRVEEGDFVYNRLFAWKGSFALATKENHGCYVSNEFPCFTIKQNYADGRYLWQYFSRASVWEEALGLSTGGTPTSRNRLKEENLLAMKIPLPPFSEQRRIVVRIAELAAKIEEARGLRGQAVEEAEALVVSFITRALERIPLNGCLGDVLLEKPRNGWSARCDNAETGIPVLSLGAVTGFRYRKSQFKRTSEPTFPHAHYWLKDGDLLITRSNTPELVGHAALYDGSPSPCIYPDLMMRLAVNEERADKQFVHCWLRSVPVREHIGRAAKGTSPTMKKISQGAVMNIPFPSNLSLPEQRHLVAYLDNLQAKVDALKCLQAETTAELGALLPSVLDKAFKGEL